MTFDEFKVGDYAVFERTFSPGDFDGFSKLSGDRNPLHHDDSYSAQHGPDGATIVPLHLTLAPLSMVAGMIFPGEPSLYLGHEVRAVRTVRYDVPVQYSARITGMNSGYLVLAVRVVAIQQGDVVLDATMRVQARSGQWSAPQSGLVRRQARGTALVTGAMGEIGTEIAVALARSGWALLLQGRNVDARREALMDAVAGVAQRPLDFIPGDLNTPGGNIGGRRGPVGGA